MSHFEERQRKIIEEASVERKQELERLRVKVEREYKESHGWYDGDNEANSPLEADLEEE